MGIWIRSQNKENLINANKIQIADVHNIYKNAIWGDDTLLGEYSTKEKALKVLDMIQREINNEYIRDYMVFQMPLDSEVSE